MDWNSIDFTPLWITLKTGLAASFFSFFLGIIAAELVINTRGRIRAFWDGILTMPMVLPPTVAGYIMLRIFSTRRTFGGFLNHTFGIQVVHTWLGCVVAATIIAFPLMYRNARAAFEQIDENVIYAARTLGINEWKIFWKIRLPMAKPGIISGLTLAFARAIGEYGATSMLAGNIAGKTSTISQQIAMVIQSGDYATAGFWCIVITAISFVCLVSINLICGKKRK
ncbi:molybdate ABC transporter permease subunit [Agathobacter sp.]